MEAQTKLETEEHQLETAKVEVMKEKVAGEDTEKPMPQKVKGKEETL